MIAITCTTAERGVAFELCKRWMARQTLQPTRWIVVSDSRPEATAQMEVIIRQRQETGHTMCRNLITGLSLLGRTDEKVAIIEDDDWYDPEYLAFLDGKLDRHDMVGLREATYYDIRYRKHLAMGNKDHASLCSTAFRGHIVPRVMTLALQDKPYGLDIGLWGEPRIRKQLFSAPIVTGIKGLPGCVSRVDSRWTDDADLGYLSELMGSDSHVYARFREGDR